MRVIELSMEWHRSEMAGEWEILEKTHRPTLSSGTIPTCEDPVIRQGIEPGSPWWEASVLTAQPPWPQLNIMPGHSFRWCHFGTALNSEVLRADEGEARRVWSSAGMKGRGKRETPEKTRQPAASSGTIPTCENPAAVLIVVLIVFAVLIEVLSSVLIVIAVLIVVLIAVLIAIAVQSAVLSAVCAWVAS
ncbi:hypothetical protein PR048_012111 [Dryococelus australis]|uniref:Uncharacterized protein n=1 Tax=Dryococelus australis TaxID=614101 RepID=A0ABQ9HNN5_9NEOP|nr:hypothetical protein PR048_012111 [Dryococelus australis]